MDTQPHRIQVDPNGWMEHTTEWEFKSIFGCIVRLRSICVYTLLLTGKTVKDLIQEKKKWLRRWAKCIHRKFNFVISTLNDRPSICLPAQHSVHGEQQCTEILYEQKRNWKCCAHFLQNVNLRRFYDLLWLQAVTENRNEMLFARWIVENDGPRMGNGWRSRRSHVHVFFNSILFKVLCHCNCTRGACTVFASTAKINTNARC